MAMTYLHSEDLLHCDLAARSVLLSSEDTVKLAGFWQSRQSGSLLCSLAPSQESKLAVRWTAPEVFKERRFSKHTDVWWVEGERVVCVGGRSRVCVGNELPGRSMGY